MGITTIIEFLLKNKSLIILVILASVISGEGIYIRVLKSEKDTLIAEKATLKVELNGSQANVKQLDSDLKFQNAAVDKLKSDANERLKQHVAEVKKAQTDRDTYKKQAEDLLNRHAPQNMTKCDAASLLILEELKNGRK